MAADAAQSRHRSDPEKRRNKRRRWVLAALMAGVAWWLLTRQPPRVYEVSAQDAARNARQSGVPKTLFGFTPFPYDISLEAVQKTHATIAPHSTLWALHYDDGIPWKELLANAPLPPRLQQQWNDETRAIPKGHVLYVALAPLATDRKSLAPASDGKDKVEMPAELRTAPLDDARVKAAYLLYARRAVRQFKPRYLNIGIEAGQLMSRDMGRWPQFENLYFHVRDALKREFPALQIGISFGLGTLRLEREAKAAKRLIARSDYVGLSFYPYASGFDEKFGAPPYGNSPTPWREPLKWVRAYTDKPIAICETGYTTQDISLPAFGLNLKGDTTMQAAYVRELFQIARRDRHAFVVWFLAIDYDKMYEKLKSAPGSEVLTLWRNIGLLDGNATPKPAWALWKAGVAAAR